MVFSNGDDKFGPSGLKQTRPFIRIVIGGGEVWDKIFVAKFGLGTIGSDVVLKFGPALLIHVARIPFVAKGRYTIEAPVDKDAKFAILIPIGDSVLL